MPPRRRIRGASCFLLPVWYECVCVDVLSVGWSTSSEHCGFDGCVHISWGFYARAVLNAQFDFLQHDIRFRGRPRSLIHYRNYRRRHHHYFHHRYHSRFTARLFREPIFLINLSRARFHFLRFVNYLARFLLFSFSIRTLFCIRLV